MASTKCKVFDDAWATGLDSKDVSQLATFARLVSIRQSDCRSNGSFANDDSIASTLTTSRTNSVDASETAAIKGIINSGWCLSKQSNSALY